MAVKLKRRPPLTTQAQRRIWTTFSGLSDLASVDTAGSPNSDLRSQFEISNFLISNFCPSELEAPVARRLGQRGHAAVKLVASPVEDDILDSLAGGPFRQGLSDLRGGILVAGVLPAARNGCFDRARR